MHWCLRECKKCKDGPPRRCKCWRWRQRQRQQRANVVPDVVPQVIAIPDYEQSRSSSKKKAYVALGEFLKDRSYLWQLSVSSLFTLEEEGNLRELLLTMRSDDRSEVYQRANSYYCKFRTDPGVLGKRLEKFWNTEVRVVGYDVLMQASREPSYVDSVDWEDSVRQTFLTLRGAGAQWVNAPVAESMPKQDLLSLEAVSQVWNSFLGKHTSVHHSNPDAGVQDSEISEGTRTEL